MMHNLDHFDRVNSRQNVAKKSRKVRDK